MTIRESARFGMLRDYATGEFLRPATSQEWRKAAAKTASFDDDAHTGVFGCDGQRRLYVDGGPDPSVTVSDIKALEQAAVAAGDSTQAELCQQALSFSPACHAWQIGDHDAFTRCAAVILDTRLEVWNERC